MKQEILENPQSEIHFFSYIFLELLEFDRYSVFRERDDV